MKIKQFFKKVKNFLVSAIYIRLKNLQNLTKIYEKLDPDVFCEGESIWAKDGIKNGIYVKGVRGWSAPRTPEKFSIRFPKIQWKITIFWKKFRFLNILNKNFAVFQSFERNYSIFRESLEKYLEKSFSAFVAGSVGRTGAPRG